MSCDATDQKAKSSTKAPRVIELNDDALEVVTGGLRDTDSEAELIEAFKVFDRDGGA